MHATTNLAEGKASLRTGLVITPPIRHRDNLSCAEEQEGQQHVEVKACVKGCRQNVVPSSPVNMTLATL